MNSQPPSSTPLPSGAQTSAPPSFATFRFSPKFGHQTLQERMGFGPRVIPFKAIKTPLGGASSPSKAKMPIVSENATFAASVDGSKEPGTRLSPGPPVGMELLQTVGLADDSAPPQGRVASGDIWEHAKLVQDEWASVERPSLPTIQATGAVTNKDSTSKGTKGPHEMAAVSTSNPNNSVTSLTNGLSQQSLPLVLLSSAHESKNIKKEEEDVKPKQEEADPSQQRISPGLLHVLKFEPQTQSVWSSCLQVVASLKQEGPPNQYQNGGAPGLQASSSVANESQESPIRSSIHLDKPIDRRTGSSSRATKTSESYLVIREDGPLSMVHAGIKAPSPCSEQHSTNDTQNRMGGEPLSMERNTRGTVNINPVLVQPTRPQTQSTVAKHGLPTHGAIPMVQNASRRRDEPPRVYHREPHRESGLIRPKNTLLNVSTGSTVHQRAEKISAHGSSNPLSDDRGREAGGLQPPAHPARPTRLSMDHYSPVRGNSPPLHYGSHGQGRFARTPRVDSAQHPPRAASPHTPPRKHPLPAPACSRSRSPSRRTNATHSHQNEHRIGSWEQYRRSRSRSRSPRRRWAEMEYERPARGLWHRDANRGSTLTHPTYPIRPRTERRSNFTNLSDSHLPNIEHSRRTRSPDSDPLNYRSPQHLDSKEPARSMHDSYRLRHGSNGSDQQSPVSVEWDEPGRTRKTPERENAERRHSKARSDPEPSHSSKSSEEGLPIPVHMEPRPGLKRNQAEVEQQTEFVNQAPMFVEPAVKRRRIDDKDVEMESSLNDTGSSGSGIAGIIPPTGVNTISENPVTNQSMPEEYPSLPSLAPPGFQNKLLKRMAGNSFGPVSRQPVPSAGESAAFGSTPPSGDPDDAMRHQIKHNLLANHDSTDGINHPTAARVSLLDRIHRNQSQNNLHSSPTNSSTQLLASTPENPGKPTSRHTSGSKPTPPLRANVPETQPSQLLSRIELDQPLVSQSGEYVSAVMEGRGMRLVSRSRFHSGNDQDPSHSLHARVGLRADDTVPQRPRQGSKGGRGGAPRVPARGNLADRLD